MSKLQYDKLSIKFVENLLPFQNIFRIKMNQKYPYLLVDVIIPKFITIRRFSL